MVNFQVRLCFLTLVGIGFMASTIPVSTGQLAPSETRILFQLQKLLEYPEALQGWTNWTGFCYLPPSPSLKIVCSNNRVTELTVVGNKTSPSRSPPGSFKVSPGTLSGQFSIDSFFTVLTKLSNLKVLCLVSLGLWGPLPPKINRLWSLQVLNMSSNFIYGELPSTIASMANLQSIVLADNLINGSVPDLKGLVGLAELNLGGNRIGPKFPSLGSNLVSIILRNNSLRSQVPIVMSKFGQLQQLDISANKFSGPVPAFLFSLPSLQYISLAQNQLSGAFPTNVSCSNKLRFVDVSRNLLMGKLASCLGSKAANRTVLYSWNCFSSGGFLKYQHPYSYCHKEALAVKPPSKGHEEEAAESTMKLGLILAIIGGSLGIVGMVVLLILAIFRRAQARGAEDHFDRSVADKKSVLASPKPITDARRAPPTMATIGLPPYHVFTLEEIEDATNNFDPSNLMGEGSQGQIYKGWLRDGSVVQVRCIKLKQKQLPQSLMQHMEAISKLRHRHLVSVLGHCIVTYQDHPNTGSTVFIVLENVSNGTLQDYLTDWRKKEKLKWPQRLSISISIARGVQFLHTGMAPGIFGNDLKVENIVLDESLTAKISGYNISLQSKVGSESPLNALDVSDNPGSPENAEKDDIYHLGAILIEVITGKSVTSASELEILKLQLEKSSAEGVSKLRDAIDRCIQGTFAYQSLRTVIEITVNCLCKDSSKRPSIEDVLWNLQYAIQVQEGWTSSGNLSTQTY